MHLLWICGNPGYGHQGKCRTRGISLAVLLGAGNNLYRLAPDEQAGWLPEVRTSYARSGFLATGAKICSWQQSRTGCRHRLKHQKKSKGTGHWKGIRACRLSLDPGLEGKPRLSCLLRDYCPVQAPPVLVITDDQTNERVQG